MNSNQISEALDRLPLVTNFATPDNAVGVPFSIANICPAEIRINLNSGHELSILRQSFFAASDYLRSNGHDISNPISIGSSNEADNSGPLCVETRLQNNGTRCINYIVPILNQLGCVGFSGNRPNTCWYL